jgi:hypothetical protein
MEEMPGDLLGVDVDDVTDAFLEASMSMWRIRRLLRDGVNGGMSLLLCRVVLNLHLDRQNC